MGNELRTGSTWPTRWRTLWAAGVGAAALTAWGGLPAGGLLPGVSVCRAASLAPDPVDGIRQVLRTVLRDPARNPAELDFRSKQLRSQIGNLRTLGEMRRALVLQEWRDEDRDQTIADVDKGARVELAERFQTTVADTLAHGEPSARLAAAILVADIGQSGGRGLVSRVGPAAKVADSLALAATDQDARVRAACCTALGKIFPDAKVACTAIGKVIDGPTVFERRAAAEALVGLIRGAAFLFLGRGTGGTLATRADIVEMGTQIVPIAGRGTRDADEGVRRSSLEAVQACGQALADQIGDPRSRGDLPPAGRAWSADERADVEDYSRQVQEEQTELQPLAKVIADQAGNLTRTVDDPEPQVRYVTRQVLEEMALVRQRLARRAGSVPKAPPEERKKADARRQPAGILTVARRKAEADADKPADLATPADELLRGLQTALPAVVAGLKDPQRQARLLSLDVLDVLGERAGPAAVDVIAATHDQAPFVRWAAARVLGRMAPAEADAAVPALARLLSEFDLNIALAAAQALERYNGKAQAAIPELVKIVGSADVELRVAAMRALESIGTDAADAAVPALAEALRHPDPRVRKAAAELLGRFGAASLPAVPTLRTLLLDPDQDARRSAGDALLAIEPAPAK